MMTILVDTREQLPYTFAKIPRSIPFHVKRWTLDTGDYLVDPTAPTPEFIQPTTSAVAERKTLSDLYNTATSGRARFEKELDRMRVYGFRVLVIEAEWSAICNPNAHLARPTKMRPRAMLASLLAWTQRYGVHVVPCPGRAAAERITFRLLERWYRDSLASETRRLAP
jgi:ERCC4-type nuclease